MTVENLLNAIGTINDEAVQDARTYKRTGFGKAAKWGVMAACFGLILTVTMVTLPGVLRGSDNIVPPSGPDVLPGPVVTDDDNQPGVEPLQPSGEREITINWDNVAVNESAGMADAARRYYDPDLYDMENLGEEEVVAYYGWNLTPNYIPDGLTGRNGSGGFLCKEKATGEIVEDHGGRGFWVDFWEDGSQKSDDDIVIPKGFTITASKLGIFHCGLLPVDQVRTTDFGGISVTITHCSMKHGPFDPTQKAPDGLSNMPAGYYDIYTASFTLDGVEYEVSAQRMELEEVIKIVASVINVPYSEDFVVGKS